MASDEPAPPSPHARHRSLSPSSAITDDSQRSPRDTVDAGAEIQRALAPRPGAVLPATDPEQEAYMARRAENQKWLDSCAAVRENQAKFNQDRHAIVVPTKQEEAVVVAQLQAPPGRSRWRPLEALPAPWQRQQQQCQDQKHGEETRPRAKGTNEPNEREGPVRTLLKTGAKPGMMAVALRDYNAQSVEELSVREGEAVKVLAVATGGWMYVRLVDQQQQQQQQ